MIIFDECHHANADHPYNDIMKEFYFDKKLSKNPEDRQVPYIIGMTASPLVHLNTLDHELTKQRNWRLLSLLSIYTNMTMLLPMI